MKFRVMGLPPEETCLSANLFEVHKVAERAAALTQQLLAFSCRDVAKPKTLNINDVVLDID
jgi:C4-dicarboxylate-specific signal transduction histidine kinase